MTTVSNCDCETCKGQGKVQCPDCDGTGELNFGILTTRLPESHPHHAEISEIQRSAGFAESAAARLIALKPEHAESYENQLKVTLEKLEEEATAILNPEDVYL